MKKFIWPLLLAAAAFATPADANWFHNPGQNVNRNIGSAPNPTPADLRAMRTIVITEDEENTPSTPTTAKVEQKPANAPGYVQGGAKSASR